MYINNFKLFKKKQIKIGTPYTGSKNIQSGYRDKIWHSKMSHANNEKREKTNVVRYKIIKSRKNQNAQRNGNLQVLVNIESRHHDISGDERKKLKRVSQENEKTTQNQTT